MFPLIACEKYTENSVKTLFAVYSYSLFKRASILQSKVGLTERESFAIFFPSLLIVKFDYFSENFSRNGSYT